MTKKIKYAVLSLILFFPVLALAQNSEVGHGLNILRGGPFGGGLAQEDSLRGLILAVISMLLFFAGAIAVLFIIIGGYWYITSGGNEETAEKGKKALINAIIGIVVVILAYAIIAAIQNTISGP